MPRSPQEFRTGDRIQFTRNNHSAKRVNGWCGVRRPPPGAWRIRRVAERSGTRAQAVGIDETLLRKGPAIAIPVPVRTMGVAIG